MLKTVKSFTVPFLITLDTHQFNYAEGNASLVYSGLEVWGREICCELAGEDPTDAKGPPADCTAPSLGIL